MLKPIVLLACIIYRTLTLNLKPVVGVLSVPSEVDRFSQESYSTPDASYVKFIEAAGVL
jgi:hypothetical protein